MGMGSVSYVVTNNSIPDPMPAGVRKFIAPVHRGKGPSDLFPFPPHRLEEEGEKAWGLRTAPWVPLGGAEQRSHFGMRP